MEKKGKEVLDKDMEESNEDGREERGEEEEEEKEEETEGERKEKEKEKAWRIEVLKQLAVIGGGRFHHFHTSGEYFGMNTFTLYINLSPPPPGVTDGDDVNAISHELSRAEFYLKTSQDILNNYREFCKRVCHI